MTLRTFIQYSRTPDFWCGLACMAGVIALMFGLALLGGCQ